MTKKSTRIKTNNKEFEECLKNVKQEDYDLKLFVAGMTPKSALATMNIKRICEANLKGHYKLEVIDIYQQPDLAKNGEILAAPTLLKKCPLPKKKLIGDFSDTERVLRGLNLTPMLC